MHRPTVFFAATIVFVLGGAAIAWTLRSHSIAAGKATPTQVLVYGPPKASTRVILLHGLNGTPDTMDTVPYVMLTKSLARHYQVLVAPEPADNTANQALTDEALFRADPTGRVYLANWLSQFHRLARWADRHYGHKRLLVAGISWGGLHAMLAACQDPEIEGVSVSSPVVDPDSLTEFASDDLTALKLQSNGCAARLNRDSNFIGWGDADVRVGTKAVTRLLELAPLARSCRYHGLGHTSNDLTMSNMVRALKHESPVGCA